MNVLHNQKGKYLKIYLYDISIVHTLAHEKYCIYHVISQKTWDNQNLFLWFAGRYHRVIQFLQLLKNDNNHYATSLHQYHRPKE